MGYGRGNVGTGMHLVGRTKRSRVFYTADQLRAIARSNAITRNVTGAVGRNAKSIARIHKGNLINHGVIPMVFVNPDDYDRISQEDELEAVNFVDQLRTKLVTFRDVTKGFDFQAKLELSDNDVEIIIDGGQLQHLKKQLREMGKIK